MSPTSDSGFPAREFSKLTSSFVAIYRHITASHKAAVKGEPNTTSCSSTTLCDTEATTPWDDSTAWDENPAWDASSTWDTTLTVENSGSTTWDASPAWNASSTWDITPTVENTGSTTWDDSCADIETPATTLCKGAPQFLSIHGINIGSPFLATFLAPSTPLDIPAAAKHELATYLKRTVEMACFSFLTVESPWILDLLRLEYYDDVDINVYITLLGYLRSANHIPFSAFDATATSWPEVKSFCTENPSARDTIGRLRQVAVHRWDFNTHLIRDVVGFLALLKDHTRIAEIEYILSRLHDQGVDAIPPPTCATKTELLATFVRILECTLYIQAQEHCPSTLTTNHIEHEHSAELSHLAEAVLASLPSSSSSSSLSRLEIQESIRICRDLRNIAAHHNSFTPEAIQGRKDGGNVTCRYDTYADPYTALAEDAEKVAMMAGDEAAVEEIRLALWAADISVSNKARRQGQSVTHHGAQHYIDLAKKADLEKSRLNGEDARGWEAVRTLYLRYSESAEYFEKRAEVARGELGKWAEDVLTDL